MYNKEKDMLIWTSEIDINEWRENIKDWYPTEYNVDEMTDDEIYYIASAENDDTLKDEIDVLNKELGNTLVIIADLGLWYGRKHGWKLLKGTNLNDIFSETEGDYVTWYVNENGDVCCDDVHHDGTNHYVYRKIKDDISDWEFEELMCEGKSAEELTERLGDYVADIYGFEKVWAKKA